MNSQRRTMSGSLRTAMVFDMSAGTTNTWFPRRRRNFHWPLVFSCLNRWNRRKDYCAQFTGLRMSIAFTWTRNLTGKWRMLWQILPAVLRTCSWFQTLCKWCGRSSPCYKPRLSAWRISGSTVWSGSISSTWRAENILWGQTLNWCRFFRPTTGQMISTEHCIGKGKHSSEKQNEASLRAIYTRANARETRPPWHQEFLENHDQYLLGLHWSLDPPKLNLRFLVLVPHWSLDPRMKSTVRSVFSCAAILVTLPSSCTAPCDPKEWLPICQSNAPLEITRDAARPR